MPTNTRITDVPFRFLSDDEDSELVGIVNIGSHSMTLDINDPTGEQPYFIVGRTESSYFQGSDGPGKRGHRVEARWAFIGSDRYVGLWLENEHEYLFSFDLSKDATRRVAARAERHADAMNRRLPGSFETSRRR
jgi:hypothetical protein